jgi:LPXTG-motif cell wall-anchored protein
MRGRWLLRDPRAISLESGSVFSTRRFAAPIAALTLALTPTTALAQSAGDEQYEDPFSDEQSQSSSGSGSSGSGGSGTAGASASGSAAQATPSTAAPPAAAPAAAASAGTAAAEGGELPRTGLDAGLVAAIGAGLLGMGLVLRRRTADARR